METQKLQVHVDAAQLADLSAVTRCTNAAIARAGIQILSEMIDKGALADLRIRCAQSTKATGPRAHNSSTTNENRS